MSLSKKSKSQLESLTAYLKTRCLKDLSSIENELFGRTVSPDMFFRPKQSYYRDEVAKYIGYRSWNDLIGVIAPEKKKKPRRNKKSESAAAAPSYTLPVKTRQLELDLGLDDSMPQAASEPEQIEKDGYRIYTDGAAVPNPGHGAWSFVITKNDLAVMKKSGYDDWSSNNAEELSACINAMKAAKILEIKKFILYSDSNYVVKGINSWIYGWFGDDPELKNRANGRLWLELFHLKGQFECEFRWVKGHNGNKYNEMCNSLCMEQLKKHGIDTSVLSFN